MSSSTTSNAAGEPKPLVALRVAGGMGPSAALPLLDDGPHRLRRGALHLAPWRSQRDRPDFYHGLLESATMKRLAFLLALLPLAAPIFAAPATLLQPQSGERGLQM